MVIILCYISFGCQHRGHPLSMYTPNLQFSDPLPRTPCAGEMYMCLHFFQNLQTPLTLSAYMDAPKLNRKIIFNSCLIGICCACDEFSIDISQAKRLLLVLHSEHRI